MRIITSTILLTLSISVAYAQPTLTQHLKYDIGDMVTIYGCDTNGISAGMQTGTNVTWNITLNYNDSGTYTFIDKSGNSASSQFPNTNIVQRWPSGTHWFYQKTATEFRVIGRTTNVTPTVIASPYYRGAIWPFTYNDSYADTVPVSYPQGTVGNCTIYYKHKADAYGTLTVNGKTYSNVLRTISNNDSYDASNNPVEFIEYIRWWDVVNKSPILSIRRYEYKRGTTPPPPSYEIFLLKVETTVNINEVKEFSASINAYTKNGQLYLTGDLETDKSYKMHLYNYSGQCIKSEAFVAARQQFNTPIADMPTGVYFISLQSPNSPPSYIKFFHE